MVSLPNYTSTHFNRTPLLSNKVISAQNGSQSGSVFANSQQRLSDPRLIPDDFQSGLNSF